ncbi:DJ-1/PfpI family protein [Ephemerocybe angulata]|uniref:DJ-1/PfpI family protein n=1 Tax=Ephemerocybe angulata TaxID=980116 RepID=A0A8H6HHG3_9AGAR|nr:DJ-1/PfpI family protein [Tulosesus angulatus]KAF6746426.1 DJ-1/PfpI family protein [Tulosesus angulatus]
MKPLFFLALFSILYIALAIPPTNYGVLVFPAFQLLDVFGPVDVLYGNSIFHQKNLTLSIISRTLSLVSTVPLTMNTTFGASILPTHTLAFPPNELEVLIVPGGVDRVHPTVFPSLRYLIAVCTGNALVARAGLLDGKKATGNKASWVWLTTHGNGKVHWAAQARWVRSSEKIWSTSGVSAGVDGTLNFIETGYGSDNATHLENAMEWTRVTDSNHDEFAAIWGAKDVLPV